MQLVYNNEAGVDLVVLNSPLRGVPPVHAVFVGLEVGDAAHGRPARHGL
jgi:hypothetical protein